MKLIIQKDDAQECGLACLCMLFEKDYDLARNDFKSGFGCGWSEMLDYVLLQHLMSGTSSLGTETQHWIEKYFGVRLSVRHWFIINDTYFTKDDINLLKSDQSALAGVGCVGIRYDDCAHCVAFKDGVIYDPGPKDAGVLPNDVFFSDKKIKGVVVNHLYD